MRKTALFPLSCFVIATVVASSPRAAAAGSCTPTPPSLCLLDGRLRATVTWESGAEASALPLGGGNGVFLDPAGSPALALHALDDRAGSGYVGLVHGVLDTESHAGRYRLVVEDLVSGETQTYEGSAAEPAPSDLHAFDAEPEPTGPILRATADSEETPPDDVRIEATNELGEALEGIALDAATTAFSRPGSSSPDLVVSVLDGREINGHWWLLAFAEAAGEWTLRLTDRGTSAESSARVTTGGAETHWLPVALTAAPGIRVVLDAAHGVKATIDAKGGVVRANAANGTHFVLTVPANAVASPVDVTLTPVKSAQNLPFTSLVGAVEIGPANLRFQARTTLAIQPPTPTPLAQESTFAYRANGAQFFLYPAQIAKRPVVLDVLHTGGYGLARGTAAQQTAQGKRLPPKKEDQFDQRLWQVQWKARQSLPAAKASLAVAAAASGGTEAFFTSEYQQALRVALDLISNSCSAMKQLGPYVRNFVAHALDDDLTSPTVGQMLASAKSALRAGDANCYRDATTKCLAGDHKQPVPAIAWWMQLQVDQATFLVDSRKLADCLIFDLEWDTLFMESNPAPEGYTISASHRFETHNLIRFQVPAAGLPTGSAPATPNVYTAAKWLGGVPPHCESLVENGQRDPGLFTVRRLALEGNSYEDPAPTPRVDLIYNIGNPQIGLAQTCSGKRVDYLSPLAAPSYAVLHFLENPQIVSHTPAVLNDYEPYSQTWKVPQGALWAVRNYDDSFGLGNIHAQESTELDLFHKPLH